MSLPQNPLVLTCTKCSCLEQKKFVLVQNNMRVKEALVHKHESPVFLARHFRLKLILYKKTHKSPKLPHITGLYLKSASRDGSAHVFRLIPPKSNTEF